MGTVNLARFNLVDLAKRSDPNGVLADIAEVLNEANDVVKDMPMLASNAPFGHRVTIRSSLPSVGWGKINKGSTRSKGSVKQLTDTIGMLVAMSEVDAKLKDVVQDFDAKRRSDDDAFLEKFTQTVASTIFYGNEQTEEDGFTGLAPRMAALQTSSYTASYVNSMNGGADSDLTSIYVCDWGARGVHGIYPPATVGGLGKEDLGKIRCNDGDGNPMMAYTTEYKWYVGLTVEDPRHIGRIANIDISEVLADTDGSEGLLTEKCVEVFNAMATKAGMRRVAYTRREVVLALWKQVMAKSNLMITVQEYLGEFRPFLYGVPLVACDEISKDETTTGTAGGYTGAPLS
jgi:hypothetical protein